MNQNCQKLRFVHHRRNSTVHLQPKMFILWWNSNHLWWTTFWLSCVFINKKTRMTTSICSQAIWTFLGFMFIAHLWGYLHKKNRALSQLKSRFSLKRDWWTYGQTDIRTDICIYRGASFATNNNTKFAHKQSLMNSTNSKQDLIGFC